MDEMSGMLQKIRTLAVQSANGTNTKEDREAIKKEGDALAVEIARIAQQTKFGGKTVLNGYQQNNKSIFSDKTAAGGAANANSAGTVTLQVGANNGDEIKFTVDNFTFTVLASRAGAQNDAYEKAAGLKLDTASGAKAVIDLMDKMIAKVDTQRSDLGALQNRLESSIRNQDNVAANQADARSRIRDADFAEESAALSQQSIIQQAATSMLMQANSRPQLALSMLG